MKCWNLLISWSIYPVDLERIIKEMLRTLESVKEHRRFNKDRLNTLELAIELDGYTSNISLKHKRLVKSYSSYYYTLLLRSETTEYLHKRIPENIYKELLESTEKERLSRPTWSTYQIYQKV
jgi:hypothetical protein